jgi:hypothetical protein
MFTVLVVLALAALLFALASAAGKTPLWVSVVLLAIIECLRGLPLGH